MTKSILGAGCVLLLVLSSCSSDRATQANDSASLPVRAPAPVFSIDEPVTPIEETEELLLVSSDSLIAVRLEAARLHYISAMTAQDNGDSLRSATQFEEAIAILNELGYEPGIEDNQDFNDLSRTIIEDYEQYIAKQDRLDPEASVFALRQKLNQVTEVTDSVEAGAATMVVEGTTVPLEVNRLVQQSIAFFQGRGREHMERWIVRSGKYFPMMKKILKEEGVPEEIIYLSMVESGLNPLARSWAKAVGMWQFMKGTGKLYGLEANYWFDERRDFEKATRAAARHLKDLNEEFGDWYLALAAYNSGAGRVYRGIRRSGTTDYWAMRRHIPRETRGYVPQYIAVTLIGMNPGDFGFGHVVQDTPLEYEFVSVDDCISLEVLAQCAMTTEETLRELNPELVQWCTPPANEGYRLRVPKGASSVFGAGYEKLTDDQKLTYVTHLVKRRETLKTIAANYGISSQVIREANRMKSAKVSVGRTLVIPVLRDGQSVAMIAAASSPEAPATHSPIRARKTKIQKQVIAAKPSVQPIADTKGKTSVTYKVKRGDTIGHIADWFECRAADIRNWNDISYSRAIQAGTTLTIWVKKEDAQRFAATDKMTFEEKQGKVSPSKSIAEEPAQDGASIHVVQGGESLDKIAHANNISVSQLVRWNKLRSKVIQPGQQLILYAEAKELPQVASAAKAQNAEKAKNRVVHIVKKGDTLWDIARLYNVETKMLIAWNDLKRQKIYAGQELIIYRN